MINKDCMDVFLRGVIHGHRNAFEECSFVTKGLSYDEKIPDSWYAEAAEDGVMGIAESLTKKELKKVRKEMVEAICERLENQKRTEYNEEMKIDNYVRYFHALTLLQVPKNSEQVPATGKNMKYNVAYDLWALDDGDERKWQIITELAYIIPETCISKRIEKGKRHTFS